MSCQPSAIPPLDAVDIPALRERYRIERDKRMRDEGQTQYFRPKGDVLPDYAADPHLPVVTRDAISEDIDVVVLGAGWGGIMAAYHLTQAGVTDFRNIDSAGDFGGVWYWNRYPGIQCDNDAYCYLPLLEETGFMPSKKFSDGAEIQGYAKAIAERYCFADRALFHTQIASLIWDDAAQRWQVGTNRGDTIRARFVVMACGVLNMPKLPDIRGIDSFKGKMFHSARWDYGYTGGSYGDNALSGLADKRVAIVGTGATAIQAIPHLARHAKHLYVIQRTPSTVDERPNPPTNTDWAKSLEPGWQAARRANFHRAAMEAFHPGDVDLICDIWTEVSRNLAAEMEAEGWPELDMASFMERREAIDYRVMERLRARVESLVDNPSTVEALKPFYRYMCKRPLSSDDFYPAFNRANVELIDVSDTRGIEAITPTGFVANGREYPVDCIIFASGFEVTSDLDRRWGIDRIEGRGGVSLYDYWRGGPLTFQGLMTNGFPNQFYVGYIQGGLNASVTLQFGQQGAHAAHIIAEALQRGACEVEPTPEAQTAYLDRFRELEIDLSSFQRECPPGYFNNEGEVPPKWGLFRGWGHGWDAWEAMLADWRAKGDMAGLSIR